MANAKPVPIALVGGETLLGKEVRELLERSLGSKVTQYSLSVGQERKADEAELMPPLSSADWKATPILVLAGAEKGDFSQAKASVIVDIGGVLEDRPEARLRAPQVENLKPPLACAASPRIEVIAHPAAIALALILKEIHRVSPIRRSVILIFEPASERGQLGIEELQKQTVGLLSFKKQPREIYDAQLAFNLLPRYGEDAPIALEAIESKIERHLASLLTTVGPIPMPSLRVVQAPVFHGYSLSLWVEFESNSGADALAAGLVAARIDVRTADHEPPTNVGVAGQSGITAGAIANDPNCARACWLWMVADNIKLAAENALEVVREAGS
ncbi:MAG TPA: Asd/ArgC dimerization domain-containing protein [Bryobacteraceae bacterium]|nr:Asd/ArgC dimerization domain-containing protein [Bryobacteraceae bacterium]